KEARISLEVIVSIVGPALAGPWTKGAKLCQHSFRFEALADEISVEAIEFFLVVDGRSAAKSPLEGGVEQRVSVDLLKGLLNGAVGDVGCDARRAEAAGHARLAATADRGLPSRDDGRRARIVDRAVGFQPFDGGIDVRRVVPAACEALTHLRFREL